jgi:hypothetical protein
MSGDSERITGKQEVIDHEERFFFNFLICGLSVWKTRIGNKHSGHNNSSELRGPDARTVQGEVLLQALNLF